MAFPAFHRSAAHWTFVEHSATVYFRAGQRSSGFRRDDKHDRWRGHNSTGHKHQNQRGRRRNGGVAFHNHVAAIGAERGPPRTRHRSRHRRRGPFGARICRRVSLSDGSNRVARSAAPASAGMLTADVHGSHDAGGKQHRHHDIGAADSSSDIRFSIHHRAAEQRPSRHRVYRHAWTTANARGGAVFRIGPAGLTR